MALGESLNGWICARGLLKRVKTLDGNVEIADKKPSGFLAFYAVPIAGKGLMLVEAAGVEPDISVENTQLTDSENASIAENATISKSAVQSLYKDCQEFPELQPSDFPAWCKNTLKRY